MIAMCQDCHSSIAGGMPDKEKTECAICAHRIDYVRRNGHDVLVGPPPVINEIPYTATPILFGAVEVDNGQGQETQKTAETKTCQDCGENLPIGNFSPKYVKKGPNGENIYGTYNSCKECILKRIKPKMEKMKRRSAEVRREEMEIRKSQPKVCAHCKIEKPLTEFYIDRIRADGHKSNCKECTRYLRTEKRVSAKKQIQIFAASPPIHEAAIDTNHGGIKHDDGKLRMDLIPWDSVVEVAKVYTEGAKEYGDNNWRNGIRWGRVFAAILRHLFAFWTGEDMDNKTGLPHLAHAAWGCLTLLNFTKTHPGLDDRVK